MGLLQDLFGLIGDLTWGWSLIPFLVVLGVFFTIMSNFVQIRYFTTMFKVLRPDPKAGEHGHISSREALLVSVGGRVGGGNIAGGELLFDRGQDRGGQIDVSKAGDSVMRTIRGNEIGMIFQEPMTSLDPLYRIGRQLSEPLRIHGGLSARAAREKALELVKLVRLPEPEERLDAYPYELSGGPRQRVKLALGDGDAGEFGHMGRGVAIDGHGLS